MQHITLLESEKKVYGDELVTAYARFETEKEKASAEINKLRYEVKTLKNEN